MKKNSVIKAIVITFLIYVLLSWIIPGGTFQNGVFTKGETSPVGISDIFIYPISTAITSMFVLSAFVILLIGGLYGVMNKTGVYQNVVEGVTKKFKGSEKSFLVISILVFGVLASLTTLTLPLFILVPFFVAVILSLGFNKMTALLSTVGAILVGNMGTLFGYNEEGYNFVNYFFKLKVTDNLVFKALLFAALMVVLIIYVVKTSSIKGTKKSKKTEEEVVIPLYKKEKASKKSATPLVVISLAVFVIAMVALYNWNGALNIEKNIFDTWYNNIMAVKVNNYPLFANLLGSIKPLGLWTNYELAMLLMVAILVIGFVYNLKLKETFDAAKEGAKELLAVAAVAIFANILLLVVNSAGSTFVMSIYNSLLSTSKEFNFATMSATGIVGSIGFSQFPYLMNSLYDPANALYAKSIKEVAFTLQAMYGFTMMLVPTSAGLVMGLEFVGVSYKEWIKENWKLLLSLLATALIVIILITLV